MFTIVLQAKKQTETFNTYSGDNNILYKITSKK